MSDQSHLPRACSGSTDDVQGSDGHHTQHLPEENNEENDWVEDYHQDANYLEPIGVPPFVGLDSEGSGSTDDVHGNDDGNDPGHHTQHLAEDSNAGNNWVADYHEDEYFPSVGMPPFMGLHSALYGMDALNSDEQHPINVLDNLIAEITLAAASLASDLEIPVPETGSDNDLHTPTEQEIKSLKASGITSRRVEQSRMTDKYHGVQSRVPCDVEDPVQMDNSLDDQWECAICQDNDCRGPFVALQGCRHQIGATCWGQYLRTSWNQNRTTQEQQPKQLTCCCCRRPVKLWARSSRLLTHGSKEKDDLMEKEIQRRLEVMRELMTQTEKISCEATFGPLPTNQQLWATRGWFEMYFGHMEEELRIAGEFHVDEAVSSASGTTEQ